MTSADVMKRLKITRPVFYRMIEEKQLVPINPPISPFQKRQRRFLFARTDIERLAQAHEQSGDYPPSPGRSLLMAEDVPPYTAAPPRPRAEG